MTRNSRQKNECSLTVSLFLLFPCPNFGVLGKTPSIVQQFDRARVDEAIDNLIPVTARLDDTAECQPLKLVRYRCRFHTQRFGQIRYTDFFSQEEGVQYPKSRAVGKYFKCPLKRRGLIFCKQGTALEIGFYRTVLLYFR